MVAQMVVIRPEIESDKIQREALLDRAFGPGRRRKTSERLRQGRVPAEGLAFSATEGGRLLGTIRLWDVTAGTAGAALLLGPLAVSGEARGQGIGRMLMEHAVAEAKTRSHRAIILVGDEPYYGRFGFSSATVAGLSMPGPVEHGRFLGLELRLGAFAGASGLIAATGRRETKKRQAAA
jgi:predicted N-acetyltransferase YhbS